MLLFRKIFLRLALAGIAATFAILACIWYANRTVTNAAEKKIFDDPATAPFRKVALVLGCSEILRNGRTNLYFRYRINAATSLYKNNRCEYLLVSGDNSTKSYDEPTAMEEALIRSGVPADKIVKDYAGFRTLDSVVRAKEIFGQESIYIVSQPFHNERAIYLANCHGIDAIGFNAKSISFRAGIKTKIREYFARVKTMLDVHLLRTDPKFLGPPVEIK